MEIFNSLIKEVSEIIEPYSGTEYSYEKENAWADVGHNQVILQKETLFELDGVGFNLLTSSHVEDSVVEDDLESAEEEIIEPEPVVVEPEPEPVVAQASSDSSE